MHISAPPHLFSINATQFYTNSIHFECSSYMRQVVIFRPRKRAPWTDRDAQAFTGIYTKIYTHRQRATDTGAHLWNKKLVVENSIKSCTMSLVGAATADAPEGRCSILSATTLKTPEFRWVGLRKLTWQVGPARLSSLWVLALSCSDQQSRGASYTSGWRLPVPDTWYAAAAAVNVGYWKRRSGAIRISQAQSAMLLSCTAAGLSYIAAAVCHSI